MGKKHNQNTLTNKRYHANLWIDNYVGLSASDNAVSRALIRGMNHNYECHPGEKTLCKITSIKSRDTISRAVKHLAELKLIRVTKKRSEKAQYPCNHYKLLVPIEYKPEATPDDPDLGDIVQALPPLQIKNWED